MTRGVKVTVIVNSSNGVIEESSLSLVSSNGTYINAQYSGEGRYEFDLPDTRAATLMIANPKFRGILVDSWHPQNETFQLEMDGVSGSIIIHGTGYIDGLSGRLSPIKDSISRFYIYGDNISFDDIDTQPYHFVIGIPFTAEDSMRNRFELSIDGMIGKTAIINYRRLEKDSLS